MDLPRSKTPPVVLGSTRIRRGHGGTPPDSRSNTPPVVINVNDKLLADSEDAEHRAILKKTVLGSLGLRASRVPSNKSFLILDDSDDEAPQSPSFTNSASGEELTSKHNSMSTNGSNRTISRNSSIRAMKQRAAALSRSRPTSNRLSNEMPPLQTIQQSPMSPRAAMSSWHSNVDMESTAQTEATDNESHLNTRNISVRPVPLSVILSPESALQRHVLPVRAVDPTMNSESESEEEIDIENMLAALSNARLQQRTKRETRDNDSRSSVNAQKALADEFDAMLEMMPATPKSLEGEAKPKPIRNRQSSALKRPSLEDLMFDLEAATKGSPPSNTEVLQQSPRPQVSSPISMSPKATISTSSPRFTAFQQPAISLSSPKLSSSSNGSPRLTISTFQKIITPSVPQDDLNDAESTSSDTSQDNNHEVTDTNLLMDDFGSMQQVNSLSLRPQRNSVQLSRQPSLSTIREQRFEKEAEELQHSNRASDDEAVLERKLNGLGIISKSNILLNEEAMSPLSPVAHRPIAPWLNQDVQDEEDDTMESSIEVKSRNEIRDNSWSPSNIMAQQRLIVAEDGSSSETEEEQLNNAPKSNSNRATPLLNEKWSSPILKPQSPRSPREQESNRSQPIMQSPNRKQELFVVASPQRRSPVRPIQAQSDSDTEVEERNAEQKQEGLSADVHERTNSKSPRELSHRSDSDTEPETGKQTKSIQSDSDTEPEVSQSKTNNVQSDDDTEPEPERKNNFTKLNGSDDDTELKNNSAPVKEKQHSNDESETEPEQITKSLNNRSRDSMESSTSEIDMSCYAPEPLRLDTKVSNNHDMKLLESRAFSARSSPRMQSAKAVGSGSDTDVETTTLDRKRSLRSVPVSSPRSPRMFASPKYEQQTSTLSNISPNRTLPKIQSPSSNESLSPDLSKEMSDMLKDEIIPANTLKERETPPQRLSQLLAPADFGSENSETDDQKMPPPSSKWSKERLTPTHDDELSHHELMLAHMDAQNEALAQNPKSQRIQRAMGAAQSLKRRAERRRDSMFTGQYSFSDSSHDSAIGSQLSPEDWSFVAELLERPQQVAKEQPLALRKLLQSGLPKDVRGLVWQQMSGSAPAQMSDILALYEKWKLTPSPNDKIIQRDLKRTFPNVAFFQTQETESAMFRLMKAYSLHDPEVGYCQGLAFVAGPMLLNLPEEEAFCLLVQYMESYEMRQLYAPGMKGLQLCLYQLDRLLEDQLPALFQHLRDQGIVSSMYATPWFLTLFAYRLPIQVVERILDMFFADGLVVLFQVGIALLAENASHLMHLEFEALLETLKHDLFSAFDYQSQRLLEASVQVRRVTKAKLDKYASDFELRQDESTIPSNKRDSEVDLKTENEALRTQLERLSEALANSEMHHVEITDKLVQTQLSLGDLQERFTLLQKRCFDAEKQIKLRDQHIKSLETKNIELTGELSYLEEELVICKLELAETQSHDS